MSKYPTLYGLAAMAFTFTSDFASKWYMLEVVELLDRPPIEVTGFFSLVAVWNPGISFGMLSGYDQPLILSGLSTVIILVLLVWLVRSQSGFISVAIGLVIGGAAGNVVDRLRFGKVFDFLDFHLSGLHWPAFNIADSAIFIGVVLLCIHSMFLDQEIKHKEGTQ